MVHQLFKRRKSQISLHWFLPDFEGTRNSLDTNTVFVGVPSLMSRQICLVPRQQTRAAPVRPQVVTRLG
jgi:hypothetical protein